MARTVDDVAHAARRDEFLDVAQRLLETKGYERMSVQDVLHELGTSKGAFYHYFDSKQALLEAVVDRMSAAIAAHLGPVADDPDVAALEKLRRFFAALAGWKSERRDVLVALLRVWVSDDNAILRQKLRPLIANRMAPLLGLIVAQGVREGVFTAAYPEQCGQVVVSLIQELNDRLADEFLATESGSGRPRAAEDTVAAYTDAVERILGVRPGSVVLVDRKTLRGWLGPARPPKGRSS